MECTRCSGTVLSLLYMRATMHYYIISYSHNKAYNDSLLFVHIRMHLLQNNALYNVHWIHKICRLHFQSREYRQCHTCLFWLSLLENRGRLVLTLNKYCYSFTVAPQAKFDNWRRGQIFIYSCSGIINFF